MGANRIGMRASRGRRPRNRVASNVRITLRLTTDEHRSFRQAAGKKPITVWLRDLGNLCAAGRLRVYAPGARTRRVRAADVDALMRSSSALTTTDEAANLLTLASQIRSR